MLSIFNTFLHYRIFFIVTWAVVQHLLPFLPFTFPTQAQAILTEGHQNMA